MLEIARSARLAAWGTAALTSQVSVEAAVRAVTGDDEPHIVTWLDGRPLILGDLLERMRSAGVRSLRLVLPVPGDVLGLAGPPEFNRAAVDARECVLTVPLSPGRSQVAPGESPAERSGTSWGLVPVTTVFGTEREPGAFVAWHVHAVPPVRVTDVGSLAEAERDLREALRAVTDTLARLDVGRWREDTADRLAALRAGSLSPKLLPAGTPPRCLQVLLTAARLRAIITLAVEDDGAAVTGHERHQRVEALRGLDAVARRAVVAAVNGTLEPPR